jgi:glutaredoxin-like protein
MPLLSDQDRQTVSRHLEAVTQPVTLLFFTQTIGAPDTVLIAKQILDEVASLNEHVRVEEVNAILERDRAAEYGVAGVPAVVLLRNGEDTRMRFLGAPAGYEFMSLVEAIIMAGSGDSGLSPQSRQMIAERIQAPTDVLVFVTPTCPHCPRAVTLAHRMAMESPHVRATCVDATEFLDLAQQYRVTGVPKTVVNGQTEILGALPEDEYVRQVVGPPGAALEPDAAQ